MASSRSAQKFLMQRVRLIILTLSVCLSCADGNGLLFPFGAKEGDSFLPANDDGSSGRISISISFPFFDHVHDSLFVSTNGALSFLTEVSQFTPEPFPLDGDRRMIAVFWGDVDIRRGGSVSYRELHRSLASETLFARADTLINKAFVDQSRFSASWMFIATWHEVPFYGARDAALSITNTFQTVLLTNGRHSFAMYNYGKIRWTTGTVSGGDESTGLGGTPAQVGFNAGDGNTFFAVPESRTDAIVNIDQDSNIDTRGRFLFRTDNSDIVDSGCNTEGSLDVFPNSGSMLGGDIIHISGPCLEETSDIVCRFAGVEVAGRVDSNFTARCTSPTVFEVGRLPLTMSINGGDSFNYTGIFTYLSPEDTTPLVTRAKDLNWHQEGTLRITWNTETLRGYVKTIRISVYAYEEDSTTGKVSKPRLMYSPTVYSPVSYDVGSFRFRRPSLDVVPFTVGAIRVSQHNEQTPDNISTELSRPGMWSDIHNLYWLNSKADPSVWCQNWLDEARSNLDFLTDTEPCPCTLTQALVDAGRFSSHPLCNVDSPEDCKLSRPGAVHCVRADNPSESGGGQECCYGNDGNILDVARTTGGGFAERRHHSGVPPYKSAGRVPYLSHWVSDILPMECCCVHSNVSCGEYKSVRPSQTCENYTPPTPAIAAGDPHLITMDEVEYTFNGMGEYTMLETCNGSFLLQARMAVLRPGDRATVITALAAIQSDKSDQIHVEVSERRDMDVWFRQDSNNSEWSMLEFEETQIRRVLLNGVALLYREVNNTGEGVTKIVHVNFDCGVSLVVSTTAGLLSVFTSLQKELKGRTRGLYGNWNGNKSDDFERPDGVILPANSTMEEIHYKFCQKWQIKPERSLLRYPRGKGPSDYSDETFVPDFLSPSATIDEAVYAICGNDTRCAFDFAVTGNEEIARATKGAIVMYTTAVESAAIVTCDPLTVPPNGTKEVSRANVGGVASFSCDEGYNLKGEIELVCQENGTWSGEVPTCVAAPDIVDELVCEENGTRSGDVPTCAPDIVIDTSGLRAWQLALIICFSCLVLIAVVTVIRKVILAKKGSKRGYTVTPPADPVAQSSV